MRSPRPAHWTRGPHRRAVLALPAVLSAALLAACGTAAAPMASTAADSAVPAPSPIQLGSPPSPGATADAAPASTAATASSPALPSHPARPARPAAAASTTVPGAPGCPMFPADNVWNTDISRLPVSPHSAAWLRSMDAAHTSLHPDFGPNPGGYPFGIPYTVVTSAHRLVRVKFSQPRESDRGPYPFGSGTRIEGGRNAGGDRHAIMVNAQTCTLYELFSARFSGGHATAYSGAIWHLRSNHLRPAGWTSADAAGLPILPGLLNFSQVQAAVRTHTPITHAIRFTAGRTRNQFVWPARHQASSRTSLNLPPMGARFRLKASFAVSRFCTSRALYCRDAKAILREMQHYGLILADNGSNWFFQGTAQPAWPDALISLLKRIPAGSFQAVSESCLRTAGSSGRATAKAGCPIG